MVQKHIVISMIAPVAVAGILIMTILAATANAQENNNTGNPQQPIAGCGAGTDNSTCSTTPNQQPPIAPTAGCGPGTDNSTCKAITPSLQPTNITKPTNNTGNVSADFVNSILAVHNSARAAVGVPPLVWSDKLSADAKTWVEYLASSTCFPQTCVHDIEHLGTLGEGENIANTGPPRTPPQPAEMIQRIWLAEKNDYQPTNGGCASGKVCGHYTQMVWNTTKAIGCAIATSITTNSDILVCRYSPPGNYPRPPY